MCFFLVPGITNMYYSLHEISAAACTTDCTSDFLVYWCLQELLLDTVDLAQYAVRGTEADWEAATKRNKAVSQNGSGTVSIKSKVPTQLRDG